jgi:hypothetical protein
MVLVLEVARPKNMRRFFFFLLKKFTRRSLLRAVLLNYSRFSHKIRSIGGCGGGGGMTRKTRASTPPPYLDLH